MSGEFTQAHVEKINSEIEALLSKAETGEQWAEICRLEALTKRTVRLDFVYPPIPLREFDWQAIFDGDEPNDNGYMLSGHGETREAAIADLLMNAEV